MRDFERRLTKIERAVSKENHIQLSDTGLAAKLQSLLVRMSERAQKEMTLEETIELIGTKGEPFSDPAMAEKLKLILKRAMGQWTIS